MRVQIHTSRMTLGTDVDLEEFINAKDELSGADIKAICTEAGLLALRERRMRVTMEDLKVRLFPLSSPPPPLHADRGADGPGEHHVPEEGGRARGPLPLGTPSSNWQISCGLCCHFTVSFSVRGFQ